MEKRTDSKMVDLNLTISITALHINGLTTLIKRLVVRMHQKAKHN